MPGFMKFVAVNLFYRGGESGFSPCFLQFTSLHELQDWGAERGGVVACSLN